MILLPVYGPLLLYTGYALFHLAESGIPEKAEELRWHALAFAGLVAILGGLVGAPLALIRVYVAERTAKTAEEQRQIAEQGHITDRITKAVEQLGAEKTVKVLEDGKTLERTEPNLEVRLGAIYALERIAQDSERDHIPIMETLCAYVRENSNAQKPDDPPKVATAVRQKEQEALRSDPRFSTKLREWARGLPAPRADVQAALTVIGRRSAMRRAHEVKQDYRLDLSKANLQKAKLTRLNFDGANLIETRMEGADVSFASLESAFLNRARMEVADLRGVRMEGAILSEARMEGVDLLRSQLDFVSLEDARMDGAILSGAHMNGAILWNARMEGAFLTGAQIEGAELRGADLERADLTGANLKSASVQGAKLASARARAADFSVTRDMTQDQVNTFFGDRSTILPAGLPRTDLLNQEPLENPPSPDPDYEAWLAAGAPPGQPLP